MTIMDEWINKWKNKVKQLMQERRNCLSWNVCFCETGDLVIQDSIDLKKYIYIHKIAEQKHNASQHSSIGSRSLREQLGNDI